MSHELKLGRSELVTEFGDSSSLTPIVGDLHSVELLEQAEVCVAVSLTQELSRDCLCAASLRLSLCESSVRGDRGKDSLSCLSLVCVDVVVAVLVPVLTVTGLYRGICRKAVMTLSPRSGVSHSDSVSYSMFAGSGEEKVTRSWSRGEHTHTGRHTLLGEARDTPHTEQGVTGRRHPDWGGRDTCTGGEARGEPGEWSGEDASMGGEDGTTQRRSE